MIISHFDFDSHMDLFRTQTGLPAQNLLFVFHQELQAN